MDISLLTPRKKMMVVKGYLLLNQQGSIAVSNSSINLLSLLSISFFSLLISLEWLFWSFFTLEESKYVLFAALRSSLSCLIKHPVVAHWLRLLVTKIPMSVFLSLIEVKVPDRLIFLMASIADQRCLILVHHMHWKALKERFNIQPATSTGNSPYGSTNWHYQIQCSSPFHTTTDGRNMSNRKIICLILLVTFTTPSIEVNCI
jgi:hypothetical protein